MEEFENQEELKTVTETEHKVETKFDDFPRLEDLLKSEQDVKTTTQLKGLQTAKSDAVTQDRTFTKKSEEHRAFIKKRVKLVTVVYASVLTLLLAFAGINLGTMIALSKDIDANTATMKSQTEQIKTLEPLTPDASDPSRESIITLNLPRDYSDDTKELTLLDKLTILFRNILG